MSGWKPQDFATVVAFLIVGWLTVVVLFLLSLLLWRAVV